MIYSVLRPVSQRIATSLGAALAGYGMAANDVSTVVAAVPLLLGLAVDLILRRFY